MSGMFVEGPDPETYFERLTNGPYYDQWTTIRFQDIKDEYAFRHTDSPERTYLADGDAFYDPVRGWCIRTKLARREPIQQ